MNSLVMKNLTVGYDYPPVLVEVNGEINSGEWLHFLGSNGVGKSTLLKVLATLKQPLSGKLTWNGDTLIGLVKENYRTEIRYFGHGRALFHDLTVEDNWELFSALFNLSGTSDTKLVEGFSSARTVGQLSQGEKQRVELATIWPEDTPVLIMDEPFASLDPASRDTLRELLKQSRDNGTVVITASPTKVKGPDRHWLLSGQEVQKDV